jgi:hypothetical protein
LKGRKDWQSWEFWAFIECMHSIEYHCGPTQCMSKRNGQLGRWSTIHLVYFIWKPLIFTPKRKSLLFQISVCYYEYTDLQINEKSRTHMVIRNITWVELITWYYYYYYYYY